MLSKIKNQEDALMVLLVVALVIIGGCSMIFKNVVDVIYLSLLTYYFGRFLIIRKKRK